MKGVRRSGQFRTNCAHAFSDSASPACSTTSPLRPCKVAQWALRKAQIVRRSRDDPMAARTAGEARSRIPKPTNYPTLPVMGRRSRPRADEEALFATPAPYSESAFVSRRTTSSASVQDGKSRPILVQS